MGARKTVILKKLLFYGICLTGLENKRTYGIQLRLSAVVCWFYVNSWGRAKIEKLEIVSECESSGTIFMYYRTEFFS